MDFIVIPFSHYRQSADFIEKEFGEIPKTAVVLGSGLGRMAELAESSLCIPYSEIPFFPQPTAPGHSGVLYKGVLGGVPVLMFSGRLHCYEGHSMAALTYYIRVLKLIGVRNLLLTNAAGAVNADFSPGDIMLVRDHIKLVAESPLTGEHLPEFGPMFFDMSNAYHSESCEECLAAAKIAGVPLRQGVYMFFAGPQYETPAEIRAARLLGADAVGMSTVPEVIAAASCGIRTLALSLITNMAAGVSGTMLDGNDVIKQANRSYGNMSAIISALIKKIGE